MVWRPWNNRKIARTNGLPPCCVHTCCDARPFYPLKCDASWGRGYMVCLDIPADVVAEVAKDVGCGSNGALKSNVKGAQSSLEYVEPGPDPLAQPRR